MNTAFSLFIYNFIIIKKQGFNKELREVLIFYYWKCLLKDYKCFCNEQREDESLKNVSEPNIAGIMKQ